MAVVQMGTIQGNEKEPSNWIVPDICKFMPDDSSICVVNGLGDPRIMQTIERLRAAREHPNPSPYPAPTTGEQKTENR